jgi:hypothetical protein
MTNLSIRKEVKVLLVFGVVVSVGYYFWLKNKKEVKFFTHNN